MFICTSFFTQLTRIDSPTPMIFVRLPESQKLLKNIFIANISNSLTKRKGIYLRHKYLEMKKTVENNGLECLLSFQKVSPHSEVHSRLRRCPGLSLITEWFLVLL